MTRQQWLRIAANIGVVAAPAGLNYVVPSTTYWLYSSDAPTVGASGFTFTGTGIRVAPDTDGIARHIAALQIVDALWAERAPRVRLRAPSWFTPRFETAELDWRRFVLRSAAVLEHLRLISVYHPRGKPSVGYLFDFVENGVTFLLVKRIVKRA